MDRRHRVYYYVSLNLNHKFSGWWNSGWDNYGRIYDFNMKMLKQHVRSLKIMPAYLKYRSEGYYQFKASCKKEDEPVLVDLLDKLPKTDYKKIVERDLDDVFGED